MVIRSIKNLRLYLLEFCLLVPIWVLLVTLYYSHNRDTAYLITVKSNPYDVQVRIMDNSNETPKIAYKVIDNP